MNPRSTYLLQILEKIGAPLLAAVEASADTSPAEAAIVAELLGRAVQSGVDLATIMDVRDAGPEGESVRLALTALAGPLVAGHYRQTGKVPADSDIKRLVTSLSAVLIFADNFSPAAENTARLTSLEAGTAVVDDTQIMIQCLQALTPIVVTIAAYSFGRPEKKMVQDVAERLMAQAGTIASRIIPGANPVDLKRAELALLRAMTPLYCEAHLAEKNRLMALDENARQAAAQAQGGVLSLDPLWQNFDRHLAMLDIIGQTLLASQMTRPAQASGNTGGPGRPQIPGEAAIVPPVSAPQPVAPPVSAPPSSPPPSQGGYNPMAFFKPGQAKTGDEENT